MPATVQSQLQTARPSCHVPVAQEWGPRLLAALGRHCVTVCCVHLVSEAWGTVPCLASPLVGTTFTQTVWVRPLHPGCGMVTPTMEGAQTSAGPRAQAASPSLRAGQAAVHQDGPPGREGCAPPSSWAQAAVLPFWTCGKGLGPEVQARHCVHVGGGRAGVSRER